MEKPFFNLKMKKILAFDGSNGIHTTVRQNFILLVAYCHTLLNNPDPTQRIIVSASMEAWLVKLVQVTKQI